MSDKQFSDTDTNLEPLSFSQALRRVSEAKPYISDFVNLWRFGFFKRDKEDVINLAMADLTTNEGFILPILPMLRSGYSLDFFHRDRQSNNRHFEINSDSHKVNVVTDDHHISHQKSLLDDLKTKQPNFKLSGGMYFHQTKMGGCMVGYMSHYKGYRSKLFVFNNRSVPVEVEWDIVIDEANKVVSIQCVRPQKYPRLDKYPLLKETLLAGFAYNRTLSLQFILRNGGSSLEFWLRGVLHRFEEIINKSKNF